MLNFSTLALPNASATLSLGRSCLVRKEPKERSDRGTSVQSFESVDTNIVRYRRQTYFTENIMYRWIEICRSNGSMGKRSVELVTGGNRILESDT